MKPHPLTRDTIPITLGHEFSGVVKEVGPGVTSVSVGQRMELRADAFPGEVFEGKKGFLAIEWFLA